jgi:hypothetical protein
MRLLVASLMTWLALLSGVAAGVRRYALRHHLPEQRMTEGLQAGDGCLVLLGDSRMDAATDLAALHLALRGARRGLGHDRCVVQLALGATDVGGMALTARTYLAQGPRPRAVVIGKVGDSLASGVTPLGPEDMIGNNSIHLTWSRPLDVFAEVPGFPLANVGAFDTGFRFLVARSTPLGRYQSLISAKIQSLEAALTGRRPGDRNRFGGLDDMALLEGGLRARPLRQLTAVMSEPEDHRLGPWFGQLVQLLQRQQIPFVVVELPMRRAYRDQVTDTRLAQAYQQWLGEALPPRGGRFIDLAHADWVRDDLFADDLHLNAQGARLASAALGGDLAEHLPP